MSNYGDAPRRDVRHKPAEESTPPARGGALAVAPYREARSFASDGPVASDVLASHLGGSRSVGPYRDCVRPRMPE
jgi:hypothetical protein